MEETTDDNDDEPFGQPANGLMVWGEISFNSLDFTWYAISLVENGLIFQIVWFVRKSGLE